MRKELCDYLIKKSRKKSLFFITGDLGFNALEPLEKQLGKNFINAGVSEQNMLSISAAFAKEGLNTWCYSIAPFIYARPFEQLRNDISFHNLPVTLIGNGGGYGYGVMGPTHHAIEDYGVMLTLPNVQAYIPAFSSDIPFIIDMCYDSKNPSYIRLGTNETEKDYKPPKFSQWRNIIEGDGPVVIAIGSIAGSLINKFNKITKKNRPEFWVVSKLPLTSKNFPSKLKINLKNKKKLLVIEEHVARGGLGHEIIYYLSSQRISLKKFKHHYAMAHNFGTYGSQNFLRKKSKLDVASILNSLKQL